MEPQGLTTACWNGFCTGQGTVFTGRTKIPCRRLERGIRGNRQTVATLQGIPFGAIDRVEPTAASASRIGFDLIDQQTRGFGGALGMNRRHGREDFVSTTDSGRRRHHPIDRSVFSASYLNGSGLRRQRLIVDGLTAPQVLVIAQWLPETFRKRTRSRETFWIAQHDRTTGHLGKGWDFS